jgi:hypothetical protein
MNYLIKRKGTDETLKNKLSVPHNYPAEVIKERRRLFFF